MVNSIRFGRAVALSSCGSIRNASCGIKNMVASQCIPVLQKDLHTTQLQPVNCNFAMRMSSSISESTPKRVGKFIQLRTVKDHPNPKKRALVVFLPWLYASNSALSKYCDLYHQRGYDVLQVRNDVKYFLWPNSSKPLCREILDYLLAEDRESVLVHSMSIGAFLFTMIMIEMAENHSKYHSVREKIRANVYDSLTMGNLEHMTNGITQRTSNLVTRSLLSGIIKSYFFVTHQYTVKLYDKTVDFFKQQPLRVPTLMYVCRNDPMCDIEDFESMIKLWQGMGLKVKVIVWDKSVHASHLAKHPQDYTRALSTFLDEYERLPISKAKL